MSLIGDLSKKYSGIKFIFETKNEISDRDVEFIWKIYKTANEPSDVNIRQRELVREYSCNFLERSLLIKVSMRWFIRMLLIRLKN